MHYVRAPAPRPGELNRRSAVLNYALFQHIFPEARRPEDIPERDVLLVVACGHMAKPELFNRVGPCLLGGAAAAAVAVPPAFHDCAAPDAFDCANAGMMHGLLPYAVGGGACLLPGARPLFKLRNNSLKVVMPPPAASMHRTYPPSAAPGWERAAGAHGMLISTGPCTGRFGTLRVGPSQHLSDLQLPHFFRHPQSIWRGCCIVESPCARGQHANRSTQARHVSA